MSALWWKEWRELRGPALVGLAGMSFATAANLRSWQPDSLFSAGIRMLPHSWWMWAVALLGLGIGAAQGARENATTDRRALLAHRPVAASRIAMLKLTAGWSVVVVGAGLPLLAAIAWQVWWSPMPLLPGALIMPAAMITAGLGCHAAALAAAARGGSWPLRLALPLAAVGVIHCLRWLGIGDILAVPELLQRLALVALADLAFVCAAWGAVVAHGDPARMPRRASWAWPVVASALLGAVIASVSDWRLAHWTRTGEDAWRSYEFTPEGGVAVSCPKEAVADESDAVRLVPLDPFRPEDVAASRASRDQAEQPRHRIDQVDFTPYPLRPALDVIDFRVWVMTERDRRHPAASVAIELIQATGEVRIRALHGGGPATLPRRGGDPPFPDHAWPIQGHEGHFALRGPDGRPWWWASGEAAPRTTAGPWRSGRVIGMVAAPRAAQDNLAFIASDGVHEVDEQGVEVDRLASPVPLDDVASLWLARRGDGGVTLVTRTDLDGPLDLRCFDAGGRLVDERRLPPLRHSVPEEFTRAGAVLAALQPLAIGAQATVPYLLPVERWTYTMVGPVTPALPALPRLAVGACCALGILGWSWRRRGWTLGLAGWCVLAVLFGVAALVAYLVHAPWTRRARCLACGRHRQVSRERCEHCGAGWTVAADAARILQPAA